MVSAPPPERTMSETSTAEQLFLAAVETTTADDRAAFLDAVCAGDPALRARVDQLLSAHDGAERLVETDATRAFQPELPPTPQMTGAYVADNPPPSDLTTEELPPDANA